MQNFKDEYLTYAFILLVLLLSKIEKETGDNQP